MRGFLFVSALLALQTPGLFAQDSIRTERLDSTVVSASRAGYSTPVSFTMVGKDELRSANPSFSLPMSLQLQPSVVTYNEGGTGLGNSAMTIRGSKGSQINVTLNGITLNDSESQEVFWVNIPSLTSLISTVQVQRGLGTSANGAGAFGASINMNTAFVTPDPFGSFDFSAGSYNTFLTTVSAGSGLLPGGWYVSAAFSKGVTDGYIRNAFVDSKSAFVAAGWLSGRNSLRLTWLMGDQRSGITWDGIDYEQYEIDRRYNGAGKYKDEYGNVFYYDNQTDNYRQNHLQLNYTHSFGGGLSWSNTLNYTRGDGYDEYLKTGRSLLDYGLPDPTGEAVSDMIYRKKMGNDYYVFNSTLKYRNDALDLTGGINAARYGGAHFGEMLWARILGQKFDYDRLNREGPWYSNDTRKTDFSGFLKGEYRAGESLVLYADLQLRRLGIVMDGADDDGASVDYQADWTFFNPRGGVSWFPAEGHKLYASVALGHREPGRSDIKENVKGTVSPIRPERMVDIEAGYQWESERFRGSANLYLMEYRDMLLETGRLSDSGYNIKENVPKGYRRGIELAAAWTPVRWFCLDGNLTLSRNRIRDYVSFVPRADKKGTVEVAYGDTDMLMSPSLIGMLRATASLWKGATASLDGKYVGKQFIDNTMRDEMAIPAYGIANFSLTQSFALRTGTLSLTGYVNNLFNHLYYASGWRWESWDDGTVYTGIGVYPQAPCNATVKISYRF